MATALDEAIEPRHHRIARETTARVREIGRSRAVALAEAADAVGTEAARAASRALDELLELEPRRSSRGNELV